MIYDKATLEHLKTSDLNQLYRTISQLKENRGLLFILENLGHLPRAFDGSILVPLVNHENSQIRYWAVKNLGKLSDFQYSDLLFQAATNDTDSLVRREAVSAIGRMRDSRAVSLLIQLLADKDPKVVLQAIRGLLVFLKRSNPCQHTQTK